MELEPKTSNEDKPKTSNEDKPKTSNEDKPQNGEAPRPKKIKRTRRSYYSDSEEESFVGVESRVFRETKVHFISEEDVPLKVIKLLLYYMMPVTPKRAYYGGDSREGTIVYRTRTQAEKAIECINRVRWPEGGRMEAWMIPDEIAQ